MFYEALPLRQAVETCQSTAFCIEHCHKSPFLSPIMTLGNKSFLFWKKTCHYGYAIFSLTIWKSQKPSFFNWQQIVNWDVLKSNADFWVLLHGLHSTNFLKASWLGSDEHSGLGSSHNDVSPEQNFEILIWTWW